MRRASLNLSSLLLCSRLLFTRFSELDMGTCLDLWSSSLCDSRFHYRSLLQRPRRKPNLPVDSSTQSALPTPLDSWITLRVQFKDFFATSLQATTLQTCLLESASPTKPGYLKQPDQVQS